MNMNAFSTHANTHTNNNKFNMDERIGMHWPLHMSAVVDEQQIEEEMKKQVKRRKPKLKLKTRKVPAVDIQIQQPARTARTTRTRTRARTRSTTSRTTASRTRTTKAKIQTKTSTQMSAEAKQSKKQQPKQRIRMKKRKGTTQNNKNTNSNTNNNNKSTSPAASTIRVSNLLTREEEITLTSAIRDLNSVIRIRDDLSASKTINNPGSTSSYLPNPMYKDQNSELPYKIQPTEQEWANACNLSAVSLRRILVKGRDSRKCLLDGNVGLVTQIAKKYSNALRNSMSGFDNIGCILTLGDLIQEGNLGLMEAAERFDASKGFRFATYAVHWVRSRILRCIADNSRVIRLPAHVHTTLRTIRKTKSIMTQEFGRVPTMPELAHRLQIPVSKIQLYTDSSRPVSSLEVPLNNGRSSKSGSGDVDKRTLMDKIPSDSPTPQEDAEFESLRRDIGTAIDSLGNDLERDVLLNRFGLEDGNPRTLEETSHRMGISRDRVRRAEARALNKLRHPQRNYMLKEYVENTCDGDNRLNNNNNNSNNNDEDKRDEMMMYHSSDHGNRVTHFGADDTLNQFTPEMIWSV